MALNWIRVEDYPFECILMMERFQLRLMLDVEDRDYLSSLGLALAAHPAVKWYVEHKCPERAAGKGCGADHFHHFDDVYHSGRAVYRGHFDLLRSAAAADANPGRGF